MIDPKNTPGSFTDIRNLIFKKIWVWISNKPLVFKVCFCTFLFIIFVGLCRFNFLGPLLYRYSRLLIPVKISIVDPQDPAIALSLYYEIENNMGRRIGTLGDAVYSGDRIFLSFSTSHSCWISVFGIDSKGIHAIVNFDFSPKFVEHKQLYNYSFLLDETIGYEVYYAIASLNRFSFERDIKSYINESLYDNISKGPKNSKYELKLPQHLSQAMIYFNHLPP